ncbi:gamma-glutamyltranspeptidase/glutathione hydrolase [Geomicrobium halophilum]|uniref:Gamma-glutamyltranspeptidase/glutathione hydrolase n=1 Tax=Geomicrobium halophilum TaxID=549000 RepID=A0A841PI16_9BACL|nr:gamma-glutamyltransferase [Geomicrobium halophilum]MBB6448389.1 gamma-glutamyltranspeptidase/glutathione hydrolase [Geomicrobium halophilum]
MSRKMTVVLSMAALLLVVIGYLIGQDDGEEQADNDTEFSADDGEDGGQVDFDGDVGVSTSHPLAQEVGEEVLQDGGNAVDAAIAISLALGVVEPFGSGIGGGGAMLILDDPSETPHYYDYREMSPSVENNEDVINFAGTPGFLKGMDQIHEDHGSLDMERLVNPSIELAEEGFDVDPMLANRLFYAGTLEDPDGRIDQSAAEPFYPNDRPIREGEPLEQPDLAETLTHLRDHGFEEFYTGQLASEIAAEDTSSITEEDLAAYEVLDEEEPASGEFYGHQVYSSAPPTSGVTFIQMLQMAEQLQVGDVEPDSASFAHLFTEIKKQAYSDRLSEIGDPSHTDINTNELTSEEWTNQLANEINSSQVSMGMDQLDAPAEINDHSNTTHIVVVDDEGRMVSATNTLSNFFGSGQMTEAGFFLNNQMSNFAESETSPNAYEPHKRARSFIAPSIIISDDQQEVMGIGSPGGRRIPQILSQVIINTERFNDIDEAMEYPRFVHEEDDITEEDQIQMEGSWGDDESRAELQEYGYNTIENEDTSVFFGGIIDLTVNHEEGTVESAEDQRRVLD